MALQGRLRGKGGSIIGWVMRAEDVSFRHAVELLRAGEPVSGRAGPPPGRTVHTLLPAAVSADAHDAELLDRVVGYYHKTPLAVAGQPRRRR